MSVWDSFRDYIKTEVSDLNLSGIYHRIKEDKEYDRHQLIRVVNLALYSCEIRGVKDSIPTLSAYGSMLRDESKQLTLEELLFLVAYVDKALHSSFSNKLYI